MISSLICIQRTPLIRPMNSPVRTQPTDLPGDIHQADHQADQMSIPHGEQPGDEPGDLQGSSRWISWGASSCSLMCPSNRVVKRHVAHTWWIIGCFKVKRVLPCEEPAGAPFDPPRYIHQAVHQADQMLDPHGEQPGDQPVDEHGDLHWSVHQAIHWSRVACAFRLPCRSMGCALGCVDLCCDN